MIRMVFGGSYRVRLREVSKASRLCCTMREYGTGSLIFRIARKEELFGIGAKYDLSFIYLLAESHVPKH
jgi:hypothetical protein